VSDDSPKFESWGILEIMGHARFAGFISSQAIGGVNFVRVDVPELPAEGTMYDARPAFTKFFTQQSIFSLTPTTEETARQAARSFRSRAVAMFELPSARLPYSPGDDDDDPEDDDGGF
jgi:hypothetical protein